MFKFKSISSDQRGYAVDRDNYSSGGCEARFRRFDTYGDGLIQHSGMYGVMPEDLTDFLESLAVHLHENLSDAEYLGWIFRSRVSNDEMDFLMKIKYDEEKPKLMSLKHQKVIKPDAKVKASEAGDYEPVPSSLDGTYQGMFLTLRKCQRYSWMSQFQCLVLHEAIRDHFKGQYWQDEEFMLLWSKDQTAAFYHGFQNLRNAMYAINAALVAYENKDHLERFAERMKLRNIS
jgi:hypothetical protein